MELLLHTFEHARESGMMSIVLHINTLQLMYQKWSAVEQTRWWIAEMGLSPMEQLEVFLKYIDIRYPVVLMLASQQAITSSSSRNSTGGGGSGNQRGDHWKKKNEYKKAAVNAAPAAVAVAAPPVQQQQRTRSRVGRSGLARWQARAARRVTS
jgi:hypothetical protein